MSTSSFVRGMVSCRVPHHIRAAPRITSPVSHNLSTGHAKYLPWGKNDRCACKKPTGCSKMKLPGCKEPANECYERPRAVMPPRKKPPTLSFSECEKELNKVPPNECNCWEPADGCKRWEKTWARWDAEKNKKCNKADR